MPLATFSELTDAITAEIDRDDVADQVPNWVRLTEADVTARLREAGGVRQMICRSTAQISTEYFKVPSDFGGLKALSIISVSPQVSLQFTDASEMRLFKQRDSSAGQPRRYAIVGREFQLYPPPDGPYTLELLVYEDIPQLGDNVPANWLLTRFPNVYLYGALMQGALFLGGDPRLKDWSDAYVAGVEGIKRLDLMEQTGDRPTARLRRFG